VRGNGVQCSGGGGGDGGYSGVCDGDLEFRSLRPEMLTFDVAVKHAPKGMWPRGRTGCLIPIVIPFLG
jgi:hypothetical protein